MKKLTFKDVYDAHKKIEVGNILNLYWNKDKSFGYGYCLIVLSKDRILTAKQKGIYAITEIGQLLSGFEVKGLLIKRFKVNPNPGDIIKVEISDGIIKDKRWEIWGYGEGSVCNY